MQSIIGDKMLYNLDHIGNQKPITADIYLNNFCNNACPYCVYRRWELDDGARGMTYDEFTRYAVRLKELGVEGIILTGGGEPTITKDFDKICNWLEDNKYHYGINTNFNVLKLIAPDYLKVSLDGWDEDSYEKSRGVRKYNTVRENIFKYNEWRKDNAQNTTLGIQIVISEPEQVDKFYNGNKDLPVDYIVFRPIESTMGEYYNTKESKDKASSCIEAIKEKCNIDNRVILNFKWYLLDEKPGDKCAAHWAQLALNEKGEVIYCCHKPYEIVGHIMDSDIMEKHKNAVTNICKCDVPCRLTAPNMFVKKIEQGHADSMFI